MNGSASGGPGGRRPLIVSACLLGVACTHRAEAKTAPQVAALAGEFRLIPVCPEVAGGLTTPRPRAEQRGDGVVTEAGEDVTSAYRRGAAQALDLARAAGATAAVLKARSPSCGPDGVYDGTFRGVLRDGEGITAGALRHAGLEVLSEEDVAGGRLPSR